MDALPPDSQSPSPLAPLPVIPTADNFEMLSSRSRIVLAWIAIGVLTIVSALLQRVRSEDDVVLPASGAIVEEGIAEPDAQLLTMQDELAGRLTVGTASFFSPEDGAAIFQSQLEPLENGKWPQKVSRLLVIGRMVDVQEGLDGLDEVESMEQDELAISTIAAARNVLLAEQANEELPEAELEILKSRLGWYGLFIAREAPVETNMLAALLALVAWFGFFGCVGFVGLFVFCVLVMLGKINFRLREGAIAVAKGEFAQIAVETFAVWMAVFLGLNIAIGVTLGLTLTETPALEKSSALPLLIGIGVFIFSLFALCWANVRNRSVGWLLREAGWHRGRGFCIEIVSGFFCYACALPLLAVGLICFLILTALFGDGSQPSHPAAEALQSAGAFEFFAILFLAAVVAPIIEETMFRGLLYRHLRESLNGYGAFAAFACAALISSAIFAAIHPQGLLFAPVLMGLATSFCIFREWRGSLIAPMVAHSVNNAVTVSLGFVIMQAPVARDASAFIHSIAITS